MRIENICVRLKDSQTQITPIEITQGDNDSVKFVIELYGDGIPFDLTNYINNVNIYFNRPDSEVVRGVCTVTNSTKGIVEFVLKGNITYSVGDVRCVVKIEKDNFRLSFSQFTFRIESFIGNSNISLPDDKLGILENMINTVSNLNSNVTDKESTRETNENTRKLNETNRTNAETVRNTNETSRQQLKVQLEQLRDEINSGSGSMHVHTNKSALDIITTEKIAEWDNKSSVTTHTHTNKSVLDTITSVKTTEWDSKASSNHVHTGVYEPTIISERKRKIVYSTSQPTGTDWDIWFVYK